MGYKLKKAEREAIRCVEKLKESIKNQYGINLEEWIKIRKEELNDTEHRKDRT